MKQNEDLIRLFFPAIYDIDKDSDQQELENALQKHEALRVLTDDDSPPLLSQEQVPFRGTYRTALTAFDYTQEHVTMLPHELLSSSVMALLGKDRQKSGQTPVLFSAKPEFSRDLWRSVRERWIAAWYYLRNRYSEDELKHDAHLRKEIKELGETLLQEVRENAGDPSIVKLREAVVDLIDSLDDGINAAGN